MYETFNITFISLIPKSINLVSYNDFRPISSCNWIYEIISNRIKPILSQHISMGKFYFLENKKIHEAIGIAQEALHSIKVKKCKGMILKIDFIKSLR